MKDDTCTPPGGLGGDGRSQLGSPARRAAWRRGPLQGAGQGDGAPSAQARCPPRRAAGERCGGPASPRPASAARRLEVPFRGGRVSGRAGVDAVTPHMLPEHLLWQHLSVLGAGPQPHHGGDLAPGADMPAGDRESGAGKC